MLARTLVLVVDDEPSIGRMLKRLIERHGALVILTLGAAQALEALKAGGVDAALIDVDLGTLTSGACVGLQAKACGARVVMMSGNPVHAAMIQQAGLGAMLLKPFELSEAIESLGLTELPP